MAEETILIGEVMPPEVAAETATASSALVTPVRRAGSGRIQPGQVLNPSGRPKGHSVVTLEVKAAAKLIVDDLTYRNNLLNRARKGKLPPPVEVLLWHYAHGVPKITMDVNAKVVDVTKMATEDLRKEMADLLERL